MEAYRKLLEAFSSRERPEHFTDYSHCEECMEHDETLLANDNDSISFSDVGNISNTPISYATIDGFMYYLPGLARLASGTGGDYYLDTFLIHLDNEERRSALTSVEKLALAEYLNSLKLDIYDSIDENLDDEDLDELIAWLLK